MKTYRHRSMSDRCWNAWQRQQQIVTSSWTASARCTLPRVLSKHFDIYPWMRAHHRCVYLSLSLCSPRLYVWKCITSSVCANHVCKIEMEIDYVQTMSYFNWLHVQDTARSSLHVWTSSPGVQATLLFGATVATNICMCVVVPSYMTSMASIRA